MRYALTAKKKTKTQEERVIIMSRIINENTGNCNTETITNTGEILTDKRDNGQERPWELHKVNSLKLHELYQKAIKIDKDCITQNRLQSLEECASFLLFGINQEQKKRLKGANFCRLRTCPMCNWRKSLKLFGQVSRITDKVLEQAPTTRFIFVTFTIKNCKADELSATIDRMNQGFKNLTNKNLRIASTSKFKASLLGYIKAIEVTYNSKEDTYHPHIHCIFAVQSRYFTSGYIKKGDWQGIWQECCKLDYEPMVKVQTIKGGTAKAVAEVAKYPVKMDELANLSNEKQAVDALIVFTKILKGRRLITFGGIFADIKKQLKLEDIDSGDLVHVDDEQETEKFNEVAQVLFKFRVKVGCYVC